MIKICTKPPKRSKIQWIESPVMKEKSSLLQFRDGMKEA